MLTPFTQSGDVNFDAHTRNVEKWNREPLAGYLLLGSNSETAYLSESEKLKLIELTVQSAAKERIILAGTGLESTIETITLTNKAARLGAHAALILTPNYYLGQMTDRALIAHFNAIADASEIPILIYNVPKYTHLNISVDAVHTLSQHPNIIGMKDSKGDITQLEHFMKIVPPEFNLIVGSASVLYDALSMGIRAGILALSNFTPAACAQIQTLFQCGEHEKARTVQARMIPVNRAVTDTYGVAGLKYAATLLGYEGGEVRSPQLPLANDESASLRQILIDGGLLAS